jgi:Icc-related predicted phosphoesterase
MGRIMTKLVLCSDLHNRQKHILLPPGDILVCAGDWTSMGRSHEVRDFFKWFGSVGDYAFRICCAGNHDFMADREPEAMAAFIPDNVDYLNDSGVTRMGLKFWGSPITPFFNNWAFNRIGEDIQPHWDMIPEDTDVLITHGPPAGIGDYIPSTDEHVGCTRLLTKILSIKPRLHVFGHIHESYMNEKIGSTIFVNASICDHRYLPVNAPIVIDL